jgi:hypothetical protein
LYLCVSDDFRKEREALALPFSKSPFITGKEAELELIEVSVYFYDVVKELFLIILGRASIHEKCESGWQTSFHGPIWSVVCPMMSRFCPHMLLLAVGNCHDHSFR